MTQRNEKEQLRKLTQDIIAFLRKWGLWMGTQIFVDGQCYCFDDEGDLQVRQEPHPESYTTGLCHLGSEGQCEWKDYSNPERLLDMTFEGPLSLLLRHGEYEVSLEDVSEEVRAFIVAGRDICETRESAKKEIDSLVSGEYLWLDPDEFDSYEEWEYVTDYCEGDLDVTQEDIIRPNLSSDANELTNIEFSSRDEYDDFLGKLFCIKEAKARAYLEDDVDEDCFCSDMFYDDGDIANHIINEFIQMFEGYGFWYELGFSWSLTTYRF